MTDSAYRIAPPGFTDDEWEFSSLKTPLTKRPSTNSRPRSVAFANPAPNTGRGRPLAAKISSSAIPLLPR